MSSGSDNDRSKSSSQSPTGTEGRAKLGVVVALVVIAVGVGAAALFLGGDEAPEVVPDEEMGEPYVAGDQGEDEASVEDDEPELAIEEDDDFDPDTWDGEFREISHAEIREALHRSLGEYEPEEYDEAVREVEMSIRKAVNSLEPEKQREFALNFNREEMTEVLMAALKEHVDEETYRETEAQMEHWQGQ